MSVQDTKRNLLEHSAAKVELYISYLERYLIILDNSKHIKHINIYDVFCGIGIYEDGGKGSPVQAFDLIKRLKEQGKITKKVYLWLNDFKSQRVARVKKYIEDNDPQQQFCTVRFTSNEAEDCIDNILDYIKKNNRGARNLLFIDPYGYKAIKKKTLGSLLALGHVEILAFLPIDYIYRFYEYALNHKTEPQFSPLACFISDFFERGHKVLKCDVRDEKEFISYLCEAFSYGNSYYSTSYYIERTTNKYFALFFITKNALGFEKMLEVKWHLDEESGKGFTIKEPELFSLFYKEEARNNQFDILSEKMEQFLRIDRTNSEIYDFILRCGFLPKHANEVMRSLQDQGRLVVFSSGTSKIRKGAFYIKYISPEDKTTPHLTFRIQ